MDKEHGKLAFEFSDVSLENQVLKSGRGYYIGTFDPEQGPVSRESEEYWRSQRQAQSALSSGQWTQRVSP